LKVAIYWAAVLPIAKAIDAETAAKALLIKSVFDF